ncbi:hypothetical protein Ddye_005068 [Dipteronia dyeriana]|uniref:Uncharacterized protein n=1 Tax=Dipteronia dyeriana TaxID=168575 RepID=A0AAD9XFT6_9ROSI|nr:hypothetical protein Ddye_005068 [Dipteronia dyeriana]
MRNMLRDLIKTPEGDWYEGKLTRHAHFDTLGHIDDALNQVSAKFTNKDRCLFMASCFGHFLTMNWEIKFLGHVVVRFLLWERHHKGPIDEIQFMLRNQSVRFSKVEFCLIIGLLFGVVLDMSVYTEVENGIQQRYFPGADEVSFEEMRVVLTLREFQMGYDAVNLRLIYMLNLILMGVDERFKIPVWKFQVVENLDAFLWGAHVYKHSIYLFKYLLSSGTKGGGFKDKATNCEGSEPEAVGFRANDSEGYEPDPQRERHRQVSFTTPDLLHLQGIPREGIGRDGEVPWEDLLNDVHKALQKSEEDQ